MFDIFKKKPLTSNQALIAELRHVYELIGKLNTPVIADDFDAGYDMAIDEALDMIEGRIKLHQSLVAKNEEDV